MSFQVVVIGAGASGTIAYEIVSNRIFSH